MCNLDLPWVTVGIIVELESQLAIDLHIEPLSEQELEFDASTIQKRQVGGVVWVDYF